MNALLGKIIYAAMISACPAEALDDSLSPLSHFTEYIAALQRSEGKNAIRTVFGVKVVNLCLLSL
jgi:hypothetical protein